MSHRRPSGWRTCHPGLEALEDRRVPAQFGIPWHDAKHLSISFVPDGTQVGSYRSDLYRSLDARLPMAAWQHEILRAFQTWAVQAQVNFAVVPDGGQPLGTPGPDQHDPRFGDVRIGARPMSPDVLSISVPHDPFLSGTWSGDVLLNSAVPFGGKGIDLFPVLLHEAGHVLGLGPSDDPASVMSEHLGPARTGLAPSDIAAIRALYGPRPGDPFEGPRGNHTPGTAAPVPTPSGYDGSTPLLLYADISTPREADYFSLKAPAGYLGPATIRLQTAGVSLLAPRLTVRDAAGRVIADVASGADGGDTLRMTLSRVDPAATYSVEVRGATGDIFGVGEYALAVSFDARSTVGPGAIDALARQSYSYLSADDIHAIFLDPHGALFRPDHQADDTFATAVPLEPIGAYGSEAPDRVTASLGDPTDVDVYRIETPKGTGGGAAGESGTAALGRPLVMTVTVRATEVNGIMPRVAVFDEARRPVPSLVLAHGDGTFTVQIADARPDAAYFLRVSPDPTSGKVVGNYDLDVEFGHEAATPVTFVDSSVSGPGVRGDYSLVVNQSQLFDFLLAAGTGPPGSAVRMAIVDGQGRTLATRVAEAGTVAGGDPLLLMPGVYRVTFLSGSPGGGPTPPLAYRLYGASISDPIGPALDDPTRNPVEIPTFADPASGGPGDPYHWLAITLAAPRGPSVPPASLAPRDGIGGHELADPRLGAALLNPQAATILTAPTGAQVGGTRNDPLPTLDPPHATAVAWRSPESPGFRSDSSPDPSAATPVPFPGAGDSGPAIDPEGGRNRVAEQELASTDPSTELLPQAETPAAGLQPDRSRQGRGDPGAERSQAALGQRSRPSAPQPERVIEAKIGTDLTPAVVILGSCIVAVAHTRRRRPATPGEKLPALRGSDAGKPSPRGDVS